jgi:hypothetical protein
VKDFLTCTAVVHAAKRAPNIDNTLQHRIDSRGRLYDFAIQAFCPSVFIQLIEPTIPSGALPFQPVLS